MSAVTIPVGVTSAGAPISLFGSMANRHGLIAGATGTGKTVTLQSLAEGFSRAGVPVFTADVKGDLTGLTAVAGSKAKERAAELKLTGYTARSYPVLLWDVFGKTGHPLRTTASELGPVLLTRLLEANDTQSGIITAAFKIADDNGWLLLDLKDLQSMFTWMAENASDLQTRYGNITKASIGAIQRDLLVMEQAGATSFFGEPALRLEHLMQRDFSGRGVISILDATSLMRNPRIYTTFLLWLLSELFEQLPEVGDQEKPKLVFFFDEAHLLFDSAPKPLLERIEQVIRLIRSKGVGIYFVTQNPLDVPDSVLSQLGNRVQHALRAFTPRDQKAVKTAAQTFRQNPELDTEEIITSLAVGEALVSILDPTGVPTPVERAKVIPPESKIGPVEGPERLSVLGNSPLAGIYETVIDRESAFELLAKRASAAINEEQPPLENKIPKATEVPQQSRKEPPSQMASIGDAFMKSAVRSVGTQIGRQIMRGLLGSFLGGSRR